MPNRVWMVACLSAIAVSARAASVTVNMGPSAQNFIEFGQGPVTNGSGTFGTYTLQQGD
jgi:hypothetical protein